MMLYLKKKKKVTGKRTHDMQQSERILSNVEKGSFVLDTEDEDTVPTLQSW